MANNIYIFKKIIFSVYLNMVKSFFEWLPFWLHLIILLKNHSWNNLNHHTKPMIRIMNVPTNIVELSLIRIQCFLPFARMWITSPCMRNLTFPLRGVSFNFHALLPHFHLNWPWGNFWFQVHHLVPFMLVAIVWFHSCTSSFYKLDFHTSLTLPMCFGPSYILILWVSPSHLEVDMCSSTFYICLFLLCPFHS